MKFIPFLLIILFCSCKNDTNSQKKIADFSTDQVSPFDISIAKDSIVFSISLALPIPICSNDSSLILFDYVDSKIKVMKFHFFFQNLIPFEYS